MDFRIEKLAENIIDYSCDVNAGEKVLIEHFGDSPERLVKALIKNVYKKGAIPFVASKNNRIQRDILKDCSTEQMDMMAKYELERMKDMDAYIGIRAADNIAEFSGLSDDKMKIYMEKFMNPVHFEERVNNTKWVVMRYPNNSMAQLANMSLESFEDFYFDVCNLDYKKMSKAMDGLVDLMNNTDKVRITGKGTNLEFSIKEIPTVKCDGKMNVPDGEVYTAPVKESVNGKLSYNCPSVYQGVTYENIVFEFEKGKIVKATANDSEKINVLLDSDDGSRYIGEFAIGVNPYILKPMKDTLFDEKIMGSFHFTPGQAYEDADNGNRSTLHWDLVCIQTEEYGGGEIYFDDRLIRKDGMFVIDELKALNPENLK